MQEVQDMITAVVMEITATMLIKMVVLAVVLDQAVVMSWQLVKPKSVITVLTTTMLGVRLTMIRSMLLVLRVEVHFPLSTERTPVLVAVDMMVWVV